MALPCAALGLTVDVQPITQWIDGEFLVIFDRRAPVSRTSPEVRNPPSPRSRFTWKKDITTTVFWVGEIPTKGNPVSNAKSSWDGRWMENFGGTDFPKKRIRYQPAGFEPCQNPFYVALPFNDIGSDGRTKSIAREVVPWFHETFRRSGISVLKGRWVAIRKGDRVCFAQWEDVGPFCADHWQYVFGNDRPRPNANRNAGLDVSPAVRDYLELSDIDITDWRFADLWEVQPGPWKNLGENNIFAVQQMLGKSITKSAR